MEFTGVELRLLVEIFKILPTQVIDDTFSGIIAYYKRGYETLNAEEITCVAEAFYAKYKNKKAKMEAETKVEAQKKLEAENKKIDEAIKEIKTLLEHKKEVKNYKLGAETKKVYNLISETKMKKNNNNEEKNIETFINFNRLGGTKKN